MMLKLSKLSVERIGRSLAPLGANVLFHNGRQQTVHSVTCARENTGSVSLSAYVNASRVTDSLDSLRKIVAHQRFTTTFKHCAIMPEIGKKSQQNNDLQNCPSRFGKSASSGDSLDSSSSQNTAARRCGQEKGRREAGPRERIESLVAGPYLELFARTRREGWDVAFSPQAAKFNGEPIKPLPGQLSLLPTP